MSVASTTIAEIAIPETPMLHVFGCRNNRNWELWSPDPPTTLARGVATNTPPVEPFCPACHVLNNPMRCETCLESDELSSRVSTKAPPSAPYLTRQKAIRCTCFDIAS
jgi:hypothetical protein